MVHLLEDMGSVPHVRDDAHPPGLDDSPFENQYVRANYGNVAQMNALRNVGTIPAASEPPRYTLTEPLPGFDRVQDWWDRDQYTGQAVFAFNGLPGLAEFNNFNFFSSDTVFDFGNGNTHPSLEDTNVLTLFSTNGVSRQIVIPTDTGNTGTGWVNVAKTTPTANGVVSLTRVARARNLGIMRGRNYYRSKTGAPRRINVSMNNDDVMEEYSQILLPRTVAYATDLINYFFRGKVDLRVLWDDSAGQYNLIILNQSGENMGAGTWHLYQDDDSGNRAEVAADFSGYSGALADGVSFTATFAAMARAGRYTLVFQGTIGNEADTAVTAKVFDIVRVLIDWEPKSDQDLYMYGPDGSLIGYFNLATDFGELDNDDIGGNGPENITLKKLNKEGEYQFMINYYRGWWQEQFYNDDTMMCEDNMPEPSNVPDDVGTTCYNQTDITVTVKTYHNSSEPVREVMRTLTTPNLGGSVPARGTPEGAVGGSWFVTQIVTVDADGEVTIDGAP